MAYEHAIALAGEPFGMAKNRMGSRHAVWLPKRLHGSNGMA